MSFHPKQPPGSQLLAVGSLHAHVCLFLGSGCKNWRIRFIEPKSLCFTYRSVSEFFKITSERWLREALFKPPNSHDSAEIKQAVVSTKKDTIQFCSRYLTIYSMNLED